MYWSGIKFKTELFHCLIYVVINIVFLYIPVHELKHVVVLCPFYILQVFTGVRNKKETRTTTIRVRVVFPV